MIAIIFGKLCCFVTNLAARKAALVMLIKRLEVGNIKSAMYITVTIETWDMRMSTRQLFDVPAAYLGRKLVSWRAQTDPSSVAYSISWREPTWSATQIFHSERHVYLCITCVIKVVCAFSNSALTALSGSSLSLPTETSEKTNNHNRENRIDTSATSRWYMTHHWMFI